MGAPGAGTGGLAVLPAGTAHPRIRHQGSSTLVLPGPRRHADHPQQPAISAPPSPNAPASSVPPFEVAEQALDPDIVRSLAMRAERAGVGAVWTADYSGTVELRRMAGPLDREIGVTRWRWDEPPHAGPWRLADIDVKATIYRVTLSTGSQFDIYRWVNLIDLARLWPVLDLPGGVRAEWSWALRAAGLAGPI
jgi:hypothetical protein